MRQFAGQIAVVGEEQHTCSIAVKATYGIDAFGTGSLYKFHHGFPLLRIVACGNIVSRLIEQYIDFLFKRYGLVVELHFVGTHNLCAQLGNDLSVYRDHTGLYKFIGFATATYAGIG